MKQLLNPAFRASLLRNSTIQFIWWIIFFPGFFSTDSFAAVQMAKSGDLGNSFTASWALYVRIFSFHGNAIALLTLINGLILVYSVTRFGYAIFSARTAAISSFLLTLTPVVSGMGITLWHDILMSAGILLISAFFINIKTDSSKVKKLMLLELLPGGILASFRPNGLPTILVFALFYSIYIFLRYRSQIRQSMKLLSKVILVTTLVTIFSSNIILGLSPINSSFAKQWMQFDISCYASTADGEGFVERNIPNIGSTETWKSVEACIFISRAQISAEEAILAEEFITPAWMTGWAGFWLLLTIAFTKLGNRERLVPPILMGISLMSIHFVVAPIPDGRYALFVLIVGQLIFLGRTLDFLNRFRRVKLTI